MLVWSSMSFAESPTAEYLEKLAQLRRNLDKGENDHGSQYILCRLGRPDKMFS